MQEVNIKIPENIYQLSDKEISLIHALCFYEPDGMTKEAKKICHNIQEKLQMHRAIGSFEVWE